MNITQDTAVTLNYKIHELLQGGIAGAVLDKGDVAYLHGGYDNLFAKVEAALDGKAVGESLTVDLSVDEAFGPHHPACSAPSPRANSPRA